MFAYAKAYENFIRNFMQELEKLLKSFRNIVS